MAQRRHFRQPGESEMEFDSNSAYLDICELQVDRGDNKGYGLLAYRN